MTGNDFERNFYKQLAERFGLVAFNNKNKIEAEVGRTAYFAPIEDDKKVDIWFSDTVPDFLRRLGIQCKKRIETRKRVESIVPTVLYEMQLRPDQIPVLVNKIVTKPVTAKGKKSKKEVEVGIFVTLKLEDFFDLVEKTKPYYELQNAQEIQE